MILIGLLYPVDYSPLNDVFAIVLLLEVGLYFVVGFLMRMTLCKSSRWTSFQLIYRVHAHVTWSDTRSLSMLCS